MVLEKHQVSGPTKHGHQVQLEGSRRSSGSKGPLAWVLKDGRRRSNSRRLEVDVLAKGTGSQKKIGQGHRIVSRKYGGLGFSWELLFLSNYGN